MPSVPALSLAVLDNALSACTEPSCSRVLPHHSCLPWGEETHRQCGVQDVVQVYREEVEEALTASRGYRVARVVHISPGVGALGQTAVGQQIQYTLHRGTWLPWQHTAL